ncbi:MAG: proline--tRNA ligase [Bacteroidetes bacterium]|nr:proline--tRNA ligase [bacterium]NBP63372.1 proline--tRNA ligase [Bacteroidota bacterium]
MYQSRIFAPTLKEAPAEAQIPSHVFMMRAGLIRQLAAGVFSQLPLGYRSLKKVQSIIREEMDAIGGQEFHLPALNPIDIWEQTGRVEAMGDVMFHIKNREGLVLAPTHEEIMTYHAKQHIKSYRDMPQIWYQIQTKFRNEPRPKSGVLRGRQFTMKDAYSLDNSKEGLDKSYDLHAQAYRNIYNRCGLKFFVVGASSGAMGGSASQEFMVESPYGEDTCAIDEHSGYAANIEVASSALDPVGRIEDNPEIEAFPTPNSKTIDELIEHFSLNSDRCAKSVVYLADSKPYLILMRGNDQLNEAKLQLHVGAIQCRPAEPDELFTLTGAHAGSIGPIGLASDVTIIADTLLKDANGLVSGANKDGFHFKNIDLMRDCTISSYADLRTVQEGEPCINGNKPLRIVNAIEVGHIFKLGTKYSQALNAVFLDEQGKEQPIIMGSYGIGLERIIACAIEQSHDEHGICWPVSIAPYSVHMIGLGLHKSQEAVDACIAIHDALEQSGIDVLFDDRDVSPGIKFNDADLIGLPLQLIIGEKGLQQGQFEMKIRKSQERQTIAINKEQMIQQTVNAIIQQLQTMSS